MTATKYQPSNGTEGEIFIERWCGCCEHDRERRETGDNACEILGRSFALYADHPDYPEEWTYNDQGPCCTAFIPAGEPIPYRCDKTVDMFEGSPT